MILKKWVKIITLYIKNYKNQIMKKNLGMSKLCLNHKCISGQYQKLVDATNIVSKTDINGIITFANSKFIEMSGYSEDELIGKSHNIIRDSSMSPEVYEELWKTIKSNKSWSGVITNKRKNGEIYTVDASIFPLVDDDENIIEYIAIRHDITKLLYLNSKVDKLNKYKIEQENIALEKLEAGIVNNMSEDECQVAYHPSDVISGDFYSIYKLNNGSTFIYIFDGQGHGVAPALTVFAISSIMNQVIHEIQTITELIQKLAPNIKNFLGEIEQLSYTMILLSPDKKSLSYASGGMYPFLVKNGNNIIKYKVNNTPFMNFSPMPEVTTVELGEWDSLMIYTDGLIEHEDELLNHLNPEKLILQESSKIIQTLQEIYTHKFDDDVTCLNFNNIKS